MRYLGPILGLALCLAPPPASADDCGNPCVGDQLVKSTSVGLEHGYYVYSASPPEEIYNCEVVEISHSPGRAPNTSPLSDDPRRVTGDPVIPFDGLSPCALADMDGDGLADYNFDLDFRSLEDLGVWTVSLQCSNVNPAYCWWCDAGADPCEQCCNPLDINIQDEPEVFVITVYNSPPEASISHSGSPAWNRTVTLDGNGQDDDHPSGSGLSYHWSITAHPAGATAELSSETDEAPSITFHDERDIGHWSFHLDLDDLEGERVSVNHSFDVPNEPPTLDIDPPDPITIDALQSIAPTAASEDPDEGPAPAVVWDLVSTPPGASAGPMSNYTAGNDFTPIVTGKRDIGEWLLHVTATDNEGPSASPPGVTEADVTVTVRNLPPRIDLIGAHAIRVGDSIHAETTITADDFGDPLLFSWEVVQVPHSAGVPLHTVLSTGASLDLSTTTIDAGTWIFKLTVTEQGVAEGVDPPNTAEDTFLVLVDEDPTASISVSAAGEITGDAPPIVSTEAFPLTLDGSGSEDPDSPCPDDPDHCHDTDTPPAEVSDGIVAYTWTLIDVSPELYERYPLGRVDEVFGLDGTSAQLVFQAFDLEPGDYTFELAVWDGEGNQATATQQVSVLAVNGPPIAVATFPARYEVSVGGLVDRDVVIGGAESFDLDNVLTGEALAPGVGIIDYQWEAVPPPGCAAPALPSGPGAASFTLYSAAGPPVPNECLGTWEFQLTVGDDNTPQLQGTANTFVILGNCPQPLCIDRPKTVAPFIVDFTDETNVTVVYRLDSTVYDDPAYAFGAFTLLEIFNAADLTRPFYTSLDSNALASNRGSFLSFNWNGTGTDRTRPAAGMYSVTVTVGDYVLASGPFTASEPVSIWIAVADLDVLDTSSRFVDQGALAAGTASLHFDYSVGGGVTIDRLHWRVFDAASTLVFEQDAPGIESGTLDWDGMVGGVPLATGDYTFELEAIRSGASLGKSAPYPFTVYRLQLAPTIPVPSPLVVMVNSDDDDRDNASDLTQSPAAGGENDLVSLDFDLTPVISGDLVLSPSVMPSPVKVWTGPDKATQVVLPHTYHLPADALPAELFVEGASPGAAELLATLTPAGVAALPARRLSISTAELAVMLDTNADFVPDAQAQFVRVGLWDFAFRLAADASGAQGTLYNEQDDARMAASGNPENFIGRDGRSFFLEIRDPARNADPGVAEEISPADVEWYTLKADGTDDDHPATDGLTFVETGPDTGVFRTRAVELVTGQVDRDQATNSGVAAHPGLQAYDATDHRTRQVTAPDGRMVLRYQPGVAGAAKLAINPPLFQRNPEERRVVTFHFFNFSDTTKGVAAVPNATVEAQIRQLQERATVMGLRADVRWNPATDILDLSPASTMDLNNVGSFSYGGTLGTLAPSADQAELINLVRGVDPAGPGNADTIYVLVIRNSVNFGESFPDAWIPAGSPAQNFTFMAGMMPANDFTAAHEVLCHMLINQTLTQAEADGITAGWDSGGHYGGPPGAADTPMNLCPVVAVVSVPVVVTDALRLWDDPGHVLQQITRARTATRYLKMP